MGHPHIYEELKALGVEGSEDAGKARKWMEKVCGHLLKDGKYILYDRNDHDMWSDRVYSIYLLEKAPRQELAWCIKMQRTFPFIVIYRGLHTVNDKKEIFRLQLGGDGGPNGIRTSGMIPQ